MVALRRAKEERDRLRSQIVTFTERTRDRKYLPYVFAEQGIIARYSVLKGNEQIFAAKYKTYMPDETELRNEIERQKAIFLLTRKDEND